MVEKKSFLVYCDSLECIDFMTNNQKGELFTALLKYASGETVDEFSCGAVRASFNFMTSQINRDAGKYENIVERNRQNGMKGGRPRKDNDVISENNGEDLCVFNGCDDEDVNSFEDTCSQNNPKETQKPKKPDTDNDTDTDTDTDKETDISSSYTVKDNDVDSFKEISLPLDDGVFVIDKKKYKYYSSLYPSLNVYLCFQDMRCWLEVNRDKRRSASMMDRFISGWLSRNLSTKVSVSPQTSSALDRDNLLKQLEEMNL